MSKQPEHITINIDNRPVQVHQGMTILQVAERYDIYIPTLCAHKDLTPFGGCRMCIVEVEGMRGFPTACTTPAEDGMVIRTQTAQIQSVRKEILTLILSEHPCSCLICDEKEECKQYSGTIRKVGVTTGCRYCPNDGQCELQDVTYKIGVTELKYPVYYRNLRVEKDDPFYDRDYNLCILCGRCVRICQEIRAANAISFKQRGRQTTIGPAFKRTHLEAGCEFCGACVSVCPTGALSEKARKWKGKADREVTTTCSLCGIGCQVQLQVKGNEVISALPADDPLVNNGQLCVKGRFCVPELVNTHHRVKKPYLVRDGTTVRLTWEEANKLVVEKLSAVSPDRFAMIVSANGANEDLYIAQKFARVVMHSHAIDTSARVFYGASLNAYLDLLRMNASMEDLRQASCVLCVGLDTRFGRSVVGVELRRAIQRGAKIITINPRQHNLSLIADRWLQPVPDETAALLETLIDLTGAGTPKTSRGQTGKKTGASDKNIQDAAKTLGETTHPVILVGSDLLGHHDSPRILEAVAKLAAKAKAKIMALPAQNNLVGSILMGAYPELLPGGFASSDKARLDVLKRSWGADVPSALADPAPAVWSGLKLDVLYLIGEVPSNQTPPAAFVIYQNPYPPDPKSKVDLVLPAAAFTEIDGTVINGEGRIQRIRKAVEPQDESLPDWKILCRIARMMDIKGFDFSATADVHAEIAGLVEGFGDFDNPERTAKPLTFEGKLTALETKKRAPSKGRKEYPFLLYTSVAEHVYRGVPLAAYVEGLKALFREDVIDLNPDDAAALDIADGDEIVLSASAFERTGRANIAPGQPRGTAQAAMNIEEFPGVNPHPVRIRKGHV